MKKIKLNIINVFNYKKGNISKDWKTIRKIAPSRKTNYDSYKNSTEDKAKEFNKLFANVGEKTLKKKNTRSHPL